MTKRWLFGSLAAVMLALVAASFALQITRGTTGDGGRGSFELTMLAKLAHVGRDGDRLLAGAYEAPFLVAVEKARTSPSAGDRARALRRQAIWCAVTRRPCVPEALDALAAIPAADRLPAPADEADVLLEILVGTPIAPERARALESRLPEIRLGWFDHLLRERLHRSAGETAAADAAERAASRGATFALAAVSGFSGLLGGGVLAWLILLVSPARGRVLRRLAEGLRERGEEREGQAEPSRRLAVVVIFFAASLAIQLAAPVVGLPKDASPLSRAAWTLGVEVALLVVVLVAHAGLAGRAGLSLGFQRVSPLRALGVGAFAYLLMWPVLVLVIMPLGSLFERLGLPTRSHPIVEQLQSAGDDPRTLALWFVIAAVLAPLLEEAVFRGALHASLRARFGGRAALFAVAFVFAIIHPQIGLGLVGILIVGLTLSLVRIHEGSLWPGVVLHAINNAMALVMVTALLSG